MAKINIEAALENLDNPITNAEQDLLQREGFVQSLCQIFETAPSKESTVFALYGEWGSGKTSVKNLLIKSLEDKKDKSPLPIEFNPWAFSGQDQILEAFFSEIGRTIGRKPGGAEAAEGFQKLGAYLSFGSKSVKALHLGMDLFGIPGAKLVGLVGDQLKEGAKSAEKFGEDIETIGSNSLEHVQKTLKTGLGKLERPLLIILDDLDRLTPDQLLIIFQIVKQNANLPHVNYLLLMDAETIAERLRSKQLGSEFIEKIIQFELVLPHVPPEELKLILKKGFEAVMGKYSPQINWERWEEAWTNGCENLFTTLRRIKRFLHTLKFHVGLFASDVVLEVDPVDLFLIETVRKFAPAVHAQIPRAIKPLVCVDPVSYAMWMLEHKDKKHEFGQNELNALMELAPEAVKAEILHNLKILFPQIGQTYESKDQEGLWIRDARISHHLFFESYFRLAIPRDSLTQQDIAGLFDCAGDQVRLQARLKELYDKVGFHPILARIHCHHKRLAAESLTVFLAELWRLDESDACSGDIENVWNTRQAVQSVSRLLLQELAPEESRAKVALETLWSSGNIYALSRLVQQDIQDLDKNPDRNFRPSRIIFSEECTKTLKQYCVAELRKRAEERSLLNRPDAGVLLYLWSVLDSPKIVSDWVSKEIKDVKRLPHFLSRLIAKGTSTSHREVKVHYYITRKKLEEYCLLDTDFEERLRSIDVEKLSHWEKIAVKETIKRVEDKKAGREEPEWEWE